MLDAVLAFFKLPIGAYCAGLVMGAVLVAVYYELRRLLRELATFWKYPPVRVESSQGACRGVVRGYCGSYGGHEFMENAAGQSVCIVCGALRPPSESET